jgi:hypothetical protein
MFWILITCDIDERFLRFYVSITFDVTSNENRAGMVCFVNKILFLLKLLASHYS